MKRYKITHTTGFKYASNATASYNEVRMTPARDDRQFVIQSKLEIVPTTSSHEYVDFFGSKVVVFEVLDIHDALTITAQNTVEIRDVTVESIEVDWPNLADLTRTSIELVDASLQTQRTQPPAELVKFAKKIASQLEPAQAAEAICRHVYQSMKYRSGVTGVQSNALEAWQKKVGVCQDFAHIALGSLRAAGIPARYVSGYLHPATAPVLGEVVKGESHAWVEWFAGSWQGFDPTNDIWVGERHILVARGRDYDDVPPLRGVFAGGVNHELFVDVQIVLEA